jgi:hypothetical protein
MYSSSGRENTTFKVMAPSFAGPSWIEPAVSDGLADDGNVTIIPTHNYVTGVTL